MDTEHTSSPPLQGQVPDLHIVHPPLQKLSLDPLQPTSDLSTPQEPAAQAQPTALKHSVPHDTPQSSPSPSSKLSMPSPPSSSSLPASPGSITQIPSPMLGNHHDQVPPKSPGLQPQHPSPSPRRPSIFLARKNGQTKSQVLLENPDHTSARLSASPSSWSATSSSTDNGSSANSFIETKYRFERLPNGGHRHHLSAPKRQQFLSNQMRWLKDLWDGKKDHKEVEHGSLHSHIGPHGGGAGATTGVGMGDPAAIGEGLARSKTEHSDHSSSLLNEQHQDLDTEHQSGQAPPMKRRNTPVADFAQKFGELQQHVIGKGGFGTVRLSIKRNQETGEESVYAVKEFKYANDESHRMYMRRLTSEFCIASTLRHLNVIHTMDLVQIHGDTYSEVMEYCGGGDLYSLIGSANTLGEAESNCFFSQLINGVAFMHSMGVVHRDIKPENLLLTSDGCLKIADFGNSEVFRMPWEKKVRTSASIRGTGPFIAPEEFTEKTFDARKVDMWACGIVYLCMRLGRYTWYEASDGDPIWDGFLYKREKFFHPKDPDDPDYRPTPTHINLAALEQSSHIALAWPDDISDVIENLLEPNSKKRWQATQVLDSKWLKRIDNCHPTTRPPDQVLDESDLYSANPRPASQRVGSKVLPEESSVTGCKVAKEVRDRRSGHEHGSGHRTLDKRDESVVTPVS